MIRSGTRGRAARQPAHLLVRRVQLLRRRERPAEPGLVAAHRLQPARGRRDPRLHAFRPTTTFFAASEPPAGFDRDRETSSGRVGDLAEPVVVETGEPTNAGLAARQQHRLALPRPASSRPGEERRLVFVLGRHRPAREDRGGRGPLLASRPRSTPPSTSCAPTGTPTWGASRVDDAGPGHDRDAERLEPGPVPDHALLVALRLRLRDRARARHGHARLGPGHAGDGAQRCPARARRTLDTHWAPPVPGRPHLAPGASRSPARAARGWPAEFPAWPQWFSDDHLWLVLATCAYLRETGDLGYLDEQVALGWTASDETDLGPHAAGDRLHARAPRPARPARGSGFADWDDTMNVDHGSGKAESVWCAQQFCRAVLDLAELCRPPGQGRRRRRFRDLHAEMAAIVNAVRLGRRLVRPRLRRRRPADRRRRPRSITRSTSTRRPGP